MKFTYETMLAPFPIELSIGTLRKPTLEEIYHLGFDVYTSYETMTKLTPELFYTKMDGDEGKEIWSLFSDKQRESIKLFNVVKSDKGLLHDYIDLLNFFFEENVIFIEGYLVWLTRPIDIEELQGKNEQIPDDAIAGVIGDDDMFHQVLEAIQQVCCIYEESNIVDENGKEMKFKNSIAKELYERMQKAEKEKKEKPESNKNYSIPNIISAVSNRHPTISPINVWDLTVFQLIDSFHRLQNNAHFRIGQTNVSVWGDKENQFDINSWFENKYDTQ
jgi:hypothetical protein